MECEVGVVRSSVEERVEGREEHEECLHRVSMQSHSFTALVAHPWALEMQHQRFEFGHPGHVWRHGDSGTVVPPDLLGRRQRPRNDTARGLCKRGQQILEGSDGYSPKPMKIRYVDQATPPPAEFFELLPKLIAPPAIAPEFLIAAQMPRYFPLLSASGYDNIAVDSPT